MEVFEALLYRAELMARTGADAFPDLANASALLNERQLGADRAPAPRRQNSRQTNRTR